MRVMGFLSTSSSRRGTRSRAGLAVLVVASASVVMPFGGSQRASALATAVPLGTAASFAVLGGSTVFNTGPTIVAGDLGVSPGVVVAGFPPGTVTGSVHVNDATAISAHSDLLTASSDAAGQSSDFALAADVGSSTLQPGVHTTASDLGVTGTVTLDALGNPNAVFVLQIGGNLLTAGASQVALANGAQACNVFWQVDGIATLGSASSFNGNVLATGNILAGTAAAVQGRLLSSGGSVTVDTNTVTVPPCVPRVLIHDVQGNGAATPVAGSTVNVEGVVVATFQGANQLQGFFLEEEDADFDADPATSEGIFVYCDTCTTPIAEGQRVQASGVVSEVNGRTQIAATTAGSVVVTNAGNNLAQVTPLPLDVPVFGVVDDFYESREGMLVSFIDTLTVSDISQLERFGQITLIEGGRPQQFTETNSPSIAGYAAHLDNLNRRQVILDDDNNALNSYLGPTNGFQFVYHPRANGGWSFGTQGTDFARTGDVVNGLSGVLDWSTPGFGSSTWRVRPRAAAPPAFTVANPRPSTPPSVGGSVKVAGIDLQHYFTTLDTNPNSNTGVCGPSANQDCRGADSVAELNRQRERTSIDICAVDADAVGLTGVENTTASGTINDLLGAVNARCGGAHPYAFANTGGTLGTDAERVYLIYRSGVLSPVGPPLVDLDPIHHQPPTAQTFDVIDATRPSFGQRFTVIVADFTSRLCTAGAVGADADAGDGQACFNNTRVLQANRILTWLNSTVLPAAGDPDMAIVGDLQAYASEDPLAAFSSAGFTDATALLSGLSAYTVSDSAQIGHVNYALTSATLAPNLTGAGVWHINADESALFDYNDEIADTGEAPSEEKPDGSALVPPRVVFQPLTPYRGSDEDPVVLGLFTVADLSVTVSDNLDPVTAGTNLTYDITVTNSGPDDAVAATLTDSLPAGTTFVSMPTVAGWSCATPAVGATGSVICSNSSMPPGFSTFSLTVEVDEATSDGATLSNTPTASSTGDPDSANNSDTETTTVDTSADLVVSKIGTPDPVTAGDNVTYAITATNAGPSAAAAVAVTDTLPAGTTFVSLLSPGGWSCTTPPVGATGTVTCTRSSMATGNAVFTLVLNVAETTTNGTVISNTASASSATPDPNPGDESNTSTVTVSHINEPPAAVDDTAVTSEDGGPLAIDVLANDTDPEVGALTVAPGSWTQGAHGAVNCSAADCTYTPDPNFYGVDTFTYEASDGALTDGASVTVTVMSVNDSPVPGAVDVVVAENNSVTFNVLATATDADGDPLALSAFSQPAHGSATCTPGGACTYSPTTDYHGPDSFTFRIDDGSGASATFALRASAAATADGTVNITVTAAAVDSTVPATTTTPTTEPVTTTTLVTGTPQPVDLPATGGDVLPVLVSGLGAIAVGVVFVRRGRRRRVRSAA